MAKHGRGLICLSLTSERCDELGLNLMAAKNEAPLQTAFTVSVEARDGVTTGISAADRAHTIQVADRSELDPDGPRPARPRLPAARSKDGGVLERAGQTEAAVDLARLAGLNPAGVICEIMNDDGTMARVPDLVAYCERHGAEDGHGRRSDRLPAAHRATRRAGRGDEAADRVRRVQRGRLPVAARRQAPRGDGQGRGRAAPRTCSYGSIRECLTGDVFHSLRCDCGEQLEAALAMIEREGAGRPALPLPGGPGDRAAQQAARLQAPGGGPRHRRREPEARPAGRPARLRDRCPDPRRPRA